MTENIDGPRDLVVLLNIGKDGKIRRMPAWNYRVEHEARDVVLTGEHDQEIGRFPGMTVLGVYWAQDEEAISVPSGQRPVSRILSSGGSDGQTLLVSGTGSLATTEGARAARRLLAAGLAHLRDRDRSAGRGCECYAKLPENRHFESCPLYDEVTE